MGVGVGKYKTNPQSSKINRRKEENDISFGINTLVDHFSEAVDEECYPEALDVAVLAGFFLTGDFSKIDAVVLDAIGRMDRENLVPIVSLKVLIPIN